MTLLASLLSGVTLYLGVGLLIGFRPKSRFGRSSRPHESRRQLWLIQAGSDLTTWQFMAGSAVLGFLTLVLATMVTGAWWLAVMPAVAVTLLPRAYYNRRRAERLRQLRQA